MDAFSRIDVVIGRITFSGGGRYDLVRVPFRNRIDGARDTTSTFQRFSPRGGVSVALGSATSVYASVGQGFRAPALIEIACADPNEPCPLPFALGDDPPIDPVVATTFELGGRWDIGTAEVTAAAYRTDVGDDIFLFPYDDACEPDGSTIDGFFANIPHTRREGIELSSRLSIGPLSLRGTYAASRATFQVDDVEIFSIREEAGGENEVEKGDRLPFVPDHSASLGIAVAVHEGLSAGTDARFTGRRFLRGDEANVETPLDGYWLTDAHVAAAADGWEARLVVRNVFDSRYATFGTFNFNQGGGDVLERFLTPGTPRTLELVIRRTHGP